MLFKLNFFLILLFSTLAFSNENEIEKMIEVYNANQVRFYEKYSNKPYKGSGVVTSIIAESNIEALISKSMGLQPIYGIGIKSSEKLISCTINDKRKALSLDVNQLVQFEGRIKDISSNLNGILLDKCTISAVNKN